MQTINFALFASPTSQEDAFLPITIYIQDVNDHVPEFQNVPYSLEVDEVCCHAWFSPPKQ